MDDRDSRGKFREEVRFLQRAVAPADDDEFLPFEEKPVAGRAGGDAMAGEAGFVFEADRNGRGAGRNDDSLGVDGLLPIDGQGEWPLCELHRCDIAGQKLGAEPSGLRPHVFHQLRAHDALGKARIVLNFGGGRELSAGLPALDEER